MSWLSFLVYVITPTSPHNDRIYAPAATGKIHVASEHLMHTHWTVSKSVRSVSMGVSKLGRIDLIFLDAGEKINGAYYREEFPVADWVLKPTRAYFS